MRQRRLGGLDRGLGEHGEPGAGIAQGRSGPGAHRGRRDGRQVRTRPPPRSTRPARSKPRRSAASNSGLNVVSRPAIARDHRHHVRLVERGDRDLRRVQQHRRDRQCPVEIEDHPHSLETASAGNGVLQYSRFQGSDPGMAHQDEDASRRPGGVRRAARGPGGRSRRAEVRRGARPPGGVRRLPHRHVHRVGSRPVRLRAGRARPRGRGGGGGDRR